MTFEEMRMMASGYQPAKTFLTALRVGLFDALADGPKKEDALGAKLALDPRALGIVADALTSVGILTKGVSGYALSEEAERYLVKGREGYRGAVLEHIHASWEDWSDLEATLRTGSAKCRRKKESLPKVDEALKNFILGMENITRDMAPKVAGILPLRDRESILDLGGGPGNYALAFLAEAKGAKVFHFDLPRVTPIAKNFIAGKEGSDRIEFISGDFLKDPLGGPYDFIWTSQILHMLPEAEVERMVGRLADVLTPDGVFCVHEHFLDDDKDGPVAAAFFGVHMLAATPGGRAYSFKELEEMMRGAGLMKTERIDYGAKPRLLLGRR
ncbi:MAG: hypothetical protein C0608_06490 [Deltaproteobacteria bacterium]|nr:MAG: hypothetical protein C0608_06490 [Deltaproteobacteria bacterium]